MHIPHLAMSDFITVHVEKIVRHGEGFLSFDRTTRVGEDITIRLGKINYVIEKNGKAVIIGEDDDGGSGEMHLSCSLDALNRKLGNVIDIRNSK